MTVRGEKIEFEVVRVDADALVGEDAQVAFKDIATLEVKKPAPGKTAGLVAGGVVTVVAVVVGLLLFIAASIPATGAEYPARPARRALSRVWLRAISVALGTLIGRRGSRR
jgi:hypothetical protein